MDKIDFTCTTETYPVRTNFYRDWLKPGKKYLVTIKPETRSKTKLQNDCFHAGVRDICKKTGEDLHRQRHFVLIAAIPFGYPFFTVDGAVYPYPPSADRTTVEMGYALEGLKLCAAEEGVYLPLGLYGLE